MTGKFPLPFKLALACVLLVALGCANAFALSVEPPDEAKTYAGTYTAHDPSVEKGTWVISVGQDGTIRGKALSEVYGEEYELTGKLSADGTLLLAAGSVDTGAVFEGRVDDKGMVSGQWHNKPLGPKFAGTFSGGPAKEEGK